MKVNQFIPLLLHTAEVLAGVRHLPDATDDVLRLIAMLCGLMLSSSQALPLDPVRPPN